MDQAIRIRAFQPTDAERAAVARLNAAVPPDERHDFEPRTAAELGELDDTFARGGYTLARHVAEVVETGEIAAYAHYFHLPWAHHPARFWCAVRCDPRHRRRGIGGRLYAEVSRALDRLGAREVRAMVREEAPDLVALTARLGFVELLRSSDYELDLTRASAPAGRAAQPSALAIAPLTEERARRPGWLPALHALYVAVNREVPLPNDPDPAPSPEAFAAYLERSPTSLPEGCFIAREGERYLGLCILRRSEDDPSCLLHMFTGVDPASRGRGVARALKLATIAFGLRHGYARIATAVESNNPPMLALNEALGFVRKGGLVVLERRGLNPPLPPGYVRSPAPKGAPPGENPA